MLPLITFGYEKQSSSPKCRVVKERWFNHQVDGGRDLLYVLMNTAALDTRDFDRDCRILVGIIK